MFAVGIRRSCTQRPRSAGFSLLELLVVITIVAILLAAAIPSFAGMLERGRLKGVVEQLRSDLALARTEAEKRGRSVRVNFVRNSNGSWCYGLTTATTCDCSVVDATATNACMLDAGVLSRVSSDRTVGITLDATPGFGASLRFSNVRSTITGGTARFTSTSGYQAGVVLTGMGRIRICTVSGSTSIGEYASCPP